tara:strand:- start:108 stop:908 length:801 start_codon:yes stop_codon:yes gene_type:complete
MLKTKASIRSGLYHALKGIDVLGTDSATLFKEMSELTRTKFLVWAEALSSPNSRRKGDSVIENLCIGYQKYRELIEKLDDDYSKNGLFTISPQVIHQGTRDIYDLIKNRLIKYIHHIENEGCGLSQNYDDDNGELCWDHFNIPQVVVGFMFNEFIIEDIIYSLEEFAKVWYELSKVNAITKDENNVLSCKKKMKELMENKRFHKRYEDEGVVLLSQQYNEISGDATFPKVLLGSKKNRKYTWVPWARTSGLWQNETEDGNIKVGDW